MWTFSNRLRRANQAAAPRAETATADKGFVLVLVLWASIFLALLAAGFAAAIRTDIRAATIATERARAEALADGGVNLALLDLMAAHRTAGFERRYPIEGRPTGCLARAGAVMTIRVADEAGKINLNLANEALLSRFFAGLGASPDQAQSFASRVLDFRDSDDNPRPGGAEREAYAAAGERTLPKDGPFDTVDELDQVSGLPADLVSRARPFATVHSGVTGIDEDVAPPGLREILDSAELQTATGGFGSAATGNGGTFKSRSLKSAFSIYSLTRMPSGVQYVAHVIVEFPQRQQESYTLHQWRQGSIGDPRQWLIDETSTLPPC